MMNSFAPGGGGRVISSCSTSGIRRVVDKQMRAKGINSEKYNLDSVIM